MLDPIRRRLNIVRRGRARSKKLAGSPARIMIRVDLDTLLRGFAIDGELCEIAGFGPIPVSVIEDLLANDNAFVVAALTKAKHLVGVYHHRRRPNAHQQSALNFVYPACAVAGCSARAGLQYDHRHDWAKTKFTVMDLLDRLRGFHHGLKTTQNWALVEGTGKRAFVPPDDPRHPRHASRASPHPPLHPGQPDGINRPCHAGAGSHPRTVSVTEPPQHRPSPTLPVSERKHVDTSLIVVEGSRYTGPKIDLRRDMGLSFALDQRAFGPRRLLVLTAGGRGRLVSLAHCPQTDPPQLALEYCLDTLGADNASAAAAIAYSDERVTADPPTDLLARFDAARAAAARYDAHLIDWFTCDDTQTRSMRYSLGDVEHWWDIPRSRSTTR